MKFFYTLLILTLFTINFSYSDSLPKWIKEQTIQSIRAVDQAITQPGAPGAVAASPSKENPNYYFHWTRDAAIVMKEVVYLYSSAQSQSEKEYWKNKIISYIQFSRKNQLTQNLSGPALGLGLGEPFFEINGNAVSRQWGRPQNDGPALRALTLILLSKQLIKLNQNNFINKYLYNSEDPTNTVIRSDLDFIAQYWQMPCFDLWEEVAGTHFYTRYMQWRALTEGANLAKALGDETAARIYFTQSLQILNSLEQFWDSSRGIFLSTINRTAGNDYKFSNIDSSVIIAVVQGGLVSGPFSVSDRRIESTFNHMRGVFSNIYSINQVQKDSEGYPMAQAIGRYPEDRYNGTRIDQQGNPWFISTHAFAEYLYLLSKDPNHMRSKFMYISDGDAFIRRSKHHTDQNHHQSEQFNRENGYMQGAHDLAWSYASFLSAIRARK